jgi:hypothetical protein
MTGAQPAIADDEWIDTETPAEGLRVAVRAQDHRGLYVLPFPVEFRDDSWFNPQTGDELDCFVAGWRRFGP